MPLACTATHAAVLNKFWNHDRSHSTLALLLHPNSCTANLCIGMMVRIACHMATTTVFHAVSSIALHTAMWGCDCVQLLFTGRLITMACACSHVSVPLYGSAGKAFIVLSLLYPGIETATYLRVIYGFFLRVTVAVHTQHFGLHKAACQVIPFHIQRRFHSCHVFSPLLSCGVLLVVQQCQPLQSSWIFKPCMLGAAPSICILPNDMHCQVCFVHHGC